MEPPSIFRLFSPHPDLFRIAPHIVAMIAALGGTISAMHEQPPHDDDQ
jgi:hypothetical protein